jgi:predicted nucleic acid-binding protein
MIGTSIWIDFLIDPGRIPEVEFDPTEFVTCGPIIQKVLQGFADMHSLPAFRDRLLGVPRLSDPLSLDLFLDAANIYRDGRRKGYTIRSTTDCLIAAIAIHNEVPVWHRDRDFTTIARYTPLRAVTRYLI